MVAFSSPSPQQPLHYPHRACLARPPSRSGSSATLRQLRPTLQAYIDSGKLAGIVVAVAAYKLDIGGSPWVCHHITTRRHHTRGEKLNSLLHSFQNAAKAAKLPTGVRPYDLRHTAITGWLKRYPGAIAQKAAGHASFKTTERYVHLNGEALDVLIEQPSSKPNEKAS